MNSPTHGVVENSQMWPKFTNLATLIQGLIYELNGDAIKCARKLNENQDAIFFKSISKALF